MLYLVAFEHPKPAPETRIAKRREQAGLQIPELFFWAPFRNLCLQVCLTHFQEIQKATSTQMTQHYFVHFRRFTKIMLGQWGRHYFFNFLEIRRTNLQKKNVPAWGPEKNPESEA